ncbi:MAG: 50S ribosomal protein L22 [Planctomycetota bacterium]|nr:50S ribosomal protein L22 [Planctomycetota bacterium]
MRLQGKTVRTLAEAKGVSIITLAQAIERVGLKGDDALSAVANWMEGRDHPRCKATDVAKLAGALGVAVKDIARFTSQVMHHRGSPRKADLLVELVRGKNVLDAENLLRFSTKRAAVNVYKALRAATAEAQQHEVDESRLFVAEARVDDGPRMKRFQPKDRGRAHSIIKRFSHITITVQERA